MSVSAASIPDTSLGLTSSEIQILRQQQQIALQGGHAGNGVSRGRGTGRTSNSSSRATSAASSQGRLLLDPMSLRALSHQLDGLQAQIRGRIEYVCIVDGRSPHGHPYSPYLTVNPPSSLLHKKFFKWKT